MYEYKVIDYTVDDVACSVLELPITPKMIERGKQRRLELPDSPRNSIMKGERTEHGLVGEEMVLAYLQHVTNSRIRVVSEPTFHYDIVMYGEHVSVRIDVKTKVSDHAPHHDWDVSVAAANTTQQCDSYCFTRMFEDYSRGFLVGFKDKTDYFKEAHFLRKGEMDYDNMYRVRADCYNMKIYDLD